MQVSTQNLTPAAEDQLFEQFYTLLADLSSPQEMQLFLTSFMTSTERLVFAKRLAIAWLLEQGKSYEEINQQLRVSSATISSVADIRQSQGMQLAFRRLQLDRWAKNLLKRIMFWQKG
jgi:uncharacterized protein YerC